MFHSNAKVSDDEIDSDAEFDLPSCHTKTKTPSKSHTILEPKHKAAKNFHHKAASSMSGLDDFLKQKVEFDEKKLEHNKKRHEVFQGISQGRLNLEHQHEGHLERESQMKDEVMDRQYHLSMATKVLKMPGAGEMLKNVAESYLLTLLS